MSAKRKNCSLVHNFQRNSDQNLLGYFNGSKFGPYYEGFRAPLTFRQLFPRRKNLGSLGNAARIAILAAIEDQEGKIADANTDEQQA